MINALIEMGRSVQDLYPMPLVEIPYPAGKGKKPPKVFVVELASSSKGLLSVCEVGFFDYSIADCFTKYFFRTPPAAQGPAPSLSFKLPKTITALQQRLSILEILGYLADTKLIARSIQSEFELLKTGGQLGRGVPVLIVLKINGKWPAENEKLRETFVKSYLESLGTHKKKPLWKKEGKCHGCGGYKTIYGGVGSLLKFYTVDKYGYAPGLDPKDSWKQYALCKDCIFDLERGKRAVDDFLRFTFYGKDFWLLPSSTRNLRLVLDHFKNFHGRVHREGYEMLEDRLLYEAGQQESVVFYHFVFTRKDNQALRILLHIEEVLPSVLKKYVEIKSEVEDRFNDSLEDGESSSGNFRFLFFSAPNLRETNEKPGFTDKDFFNLVDHVFRKSFVDENFLISKAISRIRKDIGEVGERGGVPWWSVLEVLVSLEFLLEWGVLKRRTVGGAEMSNFPYRDFFVQHGDFFNHPAKKGLVLLGVLLQTFLNYQYSQRDSTPFLKVLKNLRLNQKDVQSIFMALQNKMNEYGIGHWWRRLREGVSLSFIEAGDKWSLTPDEVGFYIAIGMSLYSLPVFKEQDSNED